MLFRKKKPNIKQNLSKLNDLRVKTEHLVVIAKEKDQDSANRLSKISEEFKYMAPTKKPEALRIEDKLINVLDDIKISLAGKFEATKTSSLIQNVELLLIERKNNY